MSSRLLLAATLVASTAACGHIPGHGAGGAPDPGACGGFSGNAAGASLKAFIQSTKDLNDATIDITKTLKTACITMGNELSMSAADLGGDDTGKICNKVIATYQDNLKVSLKSKAALKIEFKPGACTVDASASASASAECSGGAGGTAGTGGASGGASGQCAASAQAEASVHATCTPPELKITLDASMAVDATKANMTIKAMQDGLPQILSVSAKIKPISDALVTWVASAKELATEGGSLAKSFGSSALCVSGQLAAVASASLNIQANVSVSVNVSASASGSVGG